ncbi:hypothetical protein sscle_06g050460 [Sclerotinia sclerotiorum 1980 UF-70]|uniref:tetrahydrofolate synthase n=1 Tax=Sclerotinia sclerotiorum (strain ATCC 18683 / 1980 / Ss-1) TaxID=665079 RepID=A0A1D9Q5W0_SCLS1|nr:hypothetical protein sscle_06g050460 [Sclerotinia sclerotiorum 1980 UF-70]
MERSYRNAVTLLESRKYRVKISRRSRASQLLKKTTCGSSGGEDSSSERTKNRLSTSGGIPKKPENESMNEWLDALGYTHKEFHVIHVTGTKGKESTCMFVKSFLSSYASRTGVLRKIGLYTNPYSPNIREPIKINSKPISEDKFARYFFEVWEILSSKFSETMMPDYMQLRLLVAVYAFICEDVDVAIMETHSGGDNDATNFVKPTAVGIAQIHVDYIDAGDPSSTDLAWHAGGIMKTNAPAFSIPQNPDVRKVLEERANEKAVSLNFVTEDHRLPITAHALKTDIKRYGCSLALALTDAYLISTCDEKYPTLSSEDISIGLDRFFWPGRFHKLELGQNSWFLDGAHHPQTVPKAAEWFALSVCEEATLSPFSYALRRIKETILSCQEPGNPKVVVFAHRTRGDGEKVVESLVKALERHRCKIKHVIFTTDWDDSSKITDSDTSAMRSYAQTWQNLSPNSSILLEPNNTAAIDLATRIGYQNHAMECLVTGSLYLTGSALRYLDPAAEKM